MTDKIPISAPASYVTATAIGFADSSEDLRLVSVEQPMPVTQIREAAPLPLAGITSASLVAGPFTPVADAPLHLQLQGEWTGTVELQRSVDGGATLGGVTIGGWPWARFSGNANEAVWQESERGASFYLAITLVSGTLDYRLSQ